MNKNIRVQEAAINDRLFSMLLDFCLVFASTVILYFVILYSVFATGFDYSNHKSKMHDIENSYNLNLEKGLDYTEYEKVLKTFYFVSFPNEIEKDFNEYYETDYSITHIYNISVLALNKEPTLEVYKNDLYSYVQEENGKFNPNILAIQLEGSGDRYKKNLHDLFYTSYNDLKDQLQIYNDEYNDLVLSVGKSEALSRAIAFLLSLIVFYLIIPLTNKYGSTLFEKIYKLAHINSKNGYLAKKYKIVLRPFIYFTIPFFAVFNGSKNSLIIILIGYFFINILLLVFSKENKDFSNRLLKISTCSINESLLFKNEKEEQDFFNTDEGKKIEDPEFLDKLSKTRNIKIPTSNNNE